MSDDWQVGDLALCIKLGEWVHSESKMVWPSRGMRAGVVARVRGVGTSPSGILTLWFEGWAGDRFQDGYGALRFRKVTPSAADEWDREVIRLLNGIPVGEPA